MGSTLGVKSDLILALRSQIFEYLRESVHRDALEYLQLAGSEKMQKKELFLRKRLSIIELFEELRSVGTRVRHQRQS